jgi:hypothetical protein
MKTQAIVVATVMSVFSHYANAGGMCSSRDGTQYCTCEYDKRCVSSENGCNCVAGQSRPLPPPTPRNLGQGRPAPPVSPPNQTNTAQQPSPPVLPPNQTSMAKPPTPAPSKSVPPVDNKTPREYVQLAETAILGADVDNAIALIDKARMRLLDQAAASNDSEQAMYKTIRELSTAKRLLSAEDYAGSLRSLDTVLRSLN